MSIGTGVAFTPGVGGDGSPGGPGNDRHMITTELLGTLHRILGRECGRGEVGPPDVDQRAVEIDEHDVAVGAALDAAVPHSEHLSAGLVQPSRPGLCQRVDGAGAERK